MGKTSGRGGQEVVLVPFPFQGHLTPMLQLAYILHSRGFSITIAHTNFNSPNPSNYPEFTFLHLQDNLEDCDTSFNNILNSITIMNENCEGPFEEYMTRMRGEVACIIYDNIMKFVDCVAKRVGLPTIVLRTTTAAYMHSHLVMFRLLEEQVIPLPDQLQLLDEIPEVDILRYKDLPLPATIQAPEVVLNFLHSYMDIRSSSAVIWNTIDMLDYSPLQQLRQYWPVPFFSIGPFHKMSPKISLTSSLEEDTSCLSWLDKQAPNSVIYISLGSMAIIDEKELLEMAQGIAKSEQPFLWVVRPSLLNGSDAIESLPEDFKKLTQERGRVVKWAPQRKVLAHSTVGGFLTHCGWNSTLESMSEGVPMICRPVFADQMVNARYLTHVWKVGLELESVTKSSIEESIRRLMVSEEGKVMRDRAFDMKNELERSKNRGGSSYESLERLVDFLYHLIVRDKTTSSLLVA